MKKNGFLDKAKTNIRKMKVELQKLSVEMPVHIDRWVERPWDAHAFVNLFVEARRISPYLTGHVDAVLYPLLVVTNVIQAI